MTKKVLFFITIFISALGSLYSQSGSSFTRIGLGDPVYSYSGRKVGMGQLGTSVADIDFIGTLNPATWSRLERTRIEFGLTYSGLIIADSKSSFFTGESEFTGFTIGFPVSTEYGVGVVAGLIPYSDISYKVVQKVSNPSLSNLNFDIEYEGKGGLSKVFLGSSYKLPLNVIVGATLDYYFGNLTYFSRIKFEGDNNFDSEYKRNYSPYGLGTTFGLISPDLSAVLGSPSIQDFRLGLAGTYIGELGVDTLFESSSTLYSDTLGRGNTTMKVPLRLSVGISFVLDKNYLFSFDYLHQVWTSYRFADAADPGLRDAGRFGLGFEYKPDRRPGYSFWEQIIFRAGLSYENLPYKVNGKGINEYAISGGISLPVAYQNTLDFGIQYASRGSKDDGLLKEDRLKISLGVSLSDLWFVRQEK